MQYYALMQIDPQDDQKGTVLAVCRRYIDDDGDLALEKWDTKQWIDFPALLDASGINGAHDYHPITEQEAQKLLGGSSPEQQAIEVPTDEKTFLQEIGHGLSSIGDRLAAFFQRAEKHDDTEECAVKPTVETKSREEEPIQEQHDQEGQEQDPFATRAFSFKAADGRTWWLQYTSNAFRDREREIFATKALNDYVDRHRQDDTKGEFWYRHIPGTKFADIKWQAMAGRFLVQAGPFDDTPVGRYFEKFLEENPNGHPEIAPFGWGTSHGYYYNEEDKKGGIYNWLEIRESTVLPSHVASNPWNPAPIQLRRNEMNAQERKDLEAIGGSRLVELVEEQAQKTTKGLEGSVDFKAIPGLAEKLQSIHDSCPDETTKMALADLMGEVTEYEAMDEMDDMADAVEYEESEMDSEMQYDEAGSGYDRKPEQKGLPRKDEKKPTKPPAASKSNASKTTSNPTEPTNHLTREEVAEAIVANREEVRGQLTQRMDSLESSVVTALKAITDAVKELQKDDKEKIAEKALDTPAASLRELTQSIRGRKEVQITNDEPTQGPRENDVARRDNSLPGFLAQFVQR